MSFVSRGFQGRRREEGDSGLTDFAGAPVARVYTVLPGDAAALRDRLRDHPAVAALLPDLEARVAAETSSPAEAAERLLRAFLERGETG